MKKLLLLLTLTIGVSASQTEACMACHGSNWEKSALGKSKIVADMDNSEIVNALNGYKDGSYGGPMTALMNGQVMKLSNTDITNIANTITEDWIEKTI